MQIKRAKHLIFLCAIFSILTCGRKENESEVRSMQVTASAYTSSRWETQGDPFLTAFGDTLKPGIKAIAVSRDLLDSGLTHNTEVWIEGLDGPFCVMDKMNRRWQKRIDIYMGTDRDSALEWGRKKVEISWKVPPSEEEQ